MQTAHKSFVGLASSIATILAGSGLILQSPCAGAAEYPSRPIRLVVGFPAGGGGDLAARVVGQNLSEAIGWPVIIDNRAGAGGTIGSDLVAKAAPDGHTLLFATTGAITISPSLQPKIPYDPKVDFSPVAMIGTFQNVLVVSPKSSLRSLKELIELAKRQPGKINYGSTGIGTTVHMAGEMLKVMAGIDMVHVAYKGNGPAVTDLTAGRIDCMFPTLASALTTIKADRLRALAVTGQARSPALEDVPTFIEAGLPGYRVVNWYGILAPRNTPAAIVQKLNSTLNSVVLRNPAVQEHIATQGIDLQPLSPPALRAFMDEEAARWASVIKLAKIKPEE